MVKLIVAIGPNNLIGNNDKMPWHIKEEFQHFKNTTLNHALLMGRTTFLGLPAVLKHRKNYVLSAQLVESADVTIYNEEQLFDLFAQYRNLADQHLFIAGGKSIYERYVNYADELIISRVKGNHTGNVYLNMNISEFCLKQTNHFAQFDVEYYVKVC